MTAPVRSTPLSIALGVVGLAIAICASPIYRTVDERGRKKIAHEILSLLDEPERENEKKD